MDNFHNAKTVSPFFSFWDQKVRLVFIVDFINPSPPNTETGLKVMTL
jgi:hypothetical protein